MSSSNIVVNVLKKKSPLFEAKCEVNAVIFSLRHFTNDHSWCSCDNIKRVVGENRVS